MRHLCSFGLLHDRTIESSLKDVSIILFREDQRSLSQEWLMVLWVFFLFEELKLYYWKLILIWNLKWRIIGPKVWGFRTASQKQPVDFKSLGLLK